MKKKITLTSEFIASLPCIKREIENAGLCPYCGSQEIEFLGYDNILSKVDIGCTDCDIFEFSYHLTEKDIEEKPSKINQDQYGKYNTGVLIWNKGEKRYIEYLEGSPEYEEVTKKILLINVGRKRKTKKVLS